MRLALLAALAAALLFFQLGSLGLTEPSEGRYAEIGRAMAASGDWVTPRLNGIPHFEKPPFAYWMVALGVRLFGENEFAVRCVAALFGVGTVLLACAIGTRLWDRRTGLWAGLFLLATPEFFGVARSITTDVFVTFWATAAIACFLRAVHAPGGAGEGNATPPPGRPAQGDAPPPPGGAAIPAAALAPGWRWAYWACLGMGMLAKGPVALAAGFLPVLVWLVARRDWAALRALAPGRGLLLACAFLAPWMALLERDNPGVIRFLVFERSATAFVSAEEFKGEPFWFFVPVVLFGCVPCTPALVGFARTFLRRDSAADPGRWTAEFVAAWAATIFVFFSLSASKLVTYILPITPALALAAARTWTAVLDDAAAGALRSLRIGYFVLLGIAAVAALGIPVVLHLDPAIWIRENLDPVPDFAPARAPGYALAAWLAVCAGGGTWLLRRGRLRLFAGAGVAAQIVALALSLAVWRTVEAEFNTIAPLARALARDLRPGDAVVSWKGFPRSLGFYLGRPVPTIDYEKRDVRLTQDRPETRELLRFGRAEMLRHVHGGERRSFLVMRYRYFWNDDELRATTRILHAAGRMVVIVPKGQE